MRIGEFARRAGVTASKVRFYERRGLIPDADRAPNGYRSYSADDLRVIAFVDRARALGFSLADIARFMKRPAAERRAKIGLADALRAKLREIDTHLAAVRARRTALVDMLTEIRGIDGKAKGSRDAVTKAVS